MFRPYSKNRQATKLISVTLSVFVYVLMLPVVSSAPRVSRAAAKPEARTQQGQQPLVPNVPPIPAGSAYRQTNFISDIPGFAPIQEPTLINPWGIAFRGTSPFWVSNNGTSSSSLFRGDVAGSPLVKNPGLNLVTVPGGLPTGVVGNATTDFAITPCAVASCPAAFILGLDHGQHHWLEPERGSKFNHRRHRSQPRRSCLYRPCQWQQLGRQPPLRRRLQQWKHRRLRRHLRTNNHYRQLCRSDYSDNGGNTFHPYNIQNIGGSLYVMYAKVGTDGKPEDGVGNGFVRRFNTDGVRDLTFGINNGPLNSPWGVAIAPSTFGIFGSALLIGNFGEGNPSIHAFNPTTGAFSARFKTRTATAS